MSKARASPLHHVLVRLASPSPASYAAFTLATHLNSTMTFLNMLVLTAAISIVAVVVAQPAANTNCGPYHDWVGCYPTSMPQCCSPFGWCSDFFNKDEWCGLEANGIYYDPNPNPKGNCKTDADCARADFGSDYFCETKGMGAGKCGIRNVKPPVNWLFSKPSPAPTTVQTTKAVIPAPTLAVAVTAAPAPAKPISSSALSNKYSFAMVYLLAGLFLLL